MAKMNATETETATKKSFRDDKNLSTFVDSLISTLTTKNQVQGDIIERKIVEKQAHLEQLEKEIAELKSAKGIVGHESDAVNSAADEYYHKLSSVFEGEELVDLLKNRLQSRFNTPALRKPQESSSVVLVAKEVSPDLTEKVLEQLDHEGKSASEIAKALGLDETKEVSRTLAYLRAQNKVRSEGEARGTKWMLA